MAEIQRKGAKKKSQGAVVWDAVLTGISYMIPFIVGGGVLEGVAKAMGGYNIAADMAATAGYSEYTLAMVIYAIGAAIFDVCVPIIGAYIGYALADKPGSHPVSPSAWSPTPSRPASWAPCSAASSPATS